MTREDVLVDMFRLLLANNITAAGLDKRDSLWENLTIDDLVVNEHMYDRLFQALVEVSNLLELRHDAGRLSRLCTEEELEAALRYKRG